MKRKVVVTGIGLTTSLGIGVNQNWKAALKNKTAIRPIQSLDTSTLRTHLGAEVAIDFNAYFPNINTNRLDRSTLLGLLTAQEAIQDAQLTPKECAQTGVFIGTCFSTVQTKEATYLKLATSETGISPLIFIKSMDNAAGGEIAIQFGLKGINQTISTACSSSAMALGEAYRLIQSGYAERILVGGLDTPITRFTIRGWERLHLISDAKKSNALKSPFSKNRNGFVLGEGAGFLLLESEKAAQKRGSKIYASLVGFGTNCDAKHLSTPDSLSQSQSILLALKEAKLAPKDIHYLNLHGTGTKMNDYVETQAIKKIFGSNSHTLPMSTAKSQIGHTMGACGAIETILTILMMKHKILLPTVQFESGDPDCDLDYIPNKSRKIDEFEYAMKTSFGFGGTNAVLILKKEL